MPRLTRRFSGIHSLAAMKLTSFVRKTAMLAAFLPSAQAALSQTLQEQLLAKVIAGADCKQSINNGLLCDYKVGDQLSFSIKDAGGIDTLVGFQHSNINAEFYAVFYFGCVVVVPGHAHPKNYDHNYGVYVSPKNGRVYRTKQECQSSK
jgi:hypothetical protein